MESRGAGPRRASFARNGLPSVAPGSRRYVCDEERRMVPKGGMWRMILSVQSVQRR
jgi:hypothetical protein